MVYARVAHVVARVWDEVMRDSPAPDWEAYSGGRTYRERLDAPKRNWSGDVIPRIVLVRWNLRRMGKPRRAPRLPA